MDRPPLVYGLVIGLLALGLLAPGIVADEAAAHDGNWKKYYRFEGSETMCAQVATTMFLVHCTGHAVNDGLAECTEG